MECGCIMGGIWMEYGWNINYMGGVWVDYGSNMGGVWVEYGCHMGYISGIWVEWSRRNDQYRKKWKI